ncbi:MAG: VWA domain-containing protein [Candidatus Margulisiibacteriota bacterium]|jgi:Ca-activated chloride channel family protein
MNHFAEPRALWLLLLLPVFIYWEIKKPRAILFFSAVNQVTNSAVRKMAWVDYLLLTLKVLALILLIISLARPQQAMEQKEIFRKGVDMMICLDASGSMAAEDLQPDRLTAAKKIIQEFVLRRENDRIGFIVFGERAITKAPLTFDREMIVNLIDKITIGIAGDATAIGQAIVNALNRIRDSEAKSKLVILVTDGESNTGVIGPIEAAKLAKDLGVRIYTIGIGSEEGAPMPVMTPQGKQYAPFPDGTLALTKLHADELVNIADLTGGRYYQARNNAQLQGIFQTIDQLEKVKLKTNISFQYKENFELFLWLGILLVLLEWVLKRTVLRVLP